MEGQPKPSISILQQARSLDCCAMLLSLPPRSSPRCLLPARYYKVDPYTSVLLVEWELQANHPIKYGNGRPYFLKSRTGVVPW